MLMHTVVESSVYCPACGSPDALQSFDCGTSTSEVGCKCGFHIGHDDDQSLCHDLRFSDELDEEDPEVLDYLNNHGQGPETQEG
jgi:hypothetical protein